MKKLRLSFVVAILAVVFVVLAIDNTGHTYSTTPPTNRCGLYGSQPTCTACHTFTGTNDATNSLTISGNPSVYTPGQVYSITVSATGGSNKYGFELACVQVNNNTNAGSFATGTGTAITNSIVSGNSISFIYHNVVNTTGTWTFNWTAPATNVGAVRFYLATNSANNSGTNSGDKIKTLVVTLNAPCAPITVVATNNGPICVGNTATLTATGGVSYLWSNGGTTATTTTTLASTNTYTVTATDANGCTGTASTVVTVNSPPIVSVSNATICQGDCAILQATSNASPSTYLWSTGASTMSTACLTTAGNYSVTVTNANGCAATASANINVVALPIVTITGITTICAGNSTTLSATGGSTYFWSNGSTTSAINVSPVNTSTTYTVTVANANGCVATGTKTVTVNALPVATITGNTNICTGGSTTLTATGGGSYAWSNGSTASAITVTAIGTYTVTVTGTNSCTATASVTVSNAFIPVITGNTTFCSGNFTFLSTSGGGTYTWSNGATLANIAVTSAGTYTVTVTTAAGCAGTASVTTTVNTSPTAATNNATICQGDCTILQATSNANPGTYLWSTGATATNISTCLTNVGSTNYTVTVTAANGCTASALANVTVNALPIVAITGNTSICTGSSTTLTATGSGSYAWSNGATTSAITVSPPNTTTTYTVTVTNTSGCVATASTIVTVGNTFAPTITGNTSICIGSSTTLTAMDSGSYAWSNGATTSAINITPSTTTTYTVTITTASGCLGTASATVTVNLNPIITTNNATICQGTCANLQANTNSSPATYLWSTGVSGTVITPCLTTVGSSTYTVTVSNANACTATATANVTVNALPTAAIAGVTNICFGNVTTLTASGGGSYAWNNGSTTSAINVSPPNASTTYTVTVTNANGCTATATKTVTAGTNLTPIITGNTTFCSGNFTLLSTSGGSNYAWSNGATLANTAVTSAGTYTVTVTNGSGCTGTASVTTTVNQSPTVSISGNTNICNGNSTTLAATGGGTYLWNNGSTASAITITAAGTYTVSVTSANGCTNTAVRTVTVGSNITPVITGNTNICTEGSTTLSTTGGGSYLWSNGSTISAITITMPGTYSVTVTNTNGCTGTASVVVTNNNPIVAATNNGPICAGSAAVLTATGGGTYFWSTNATTSSVIVLPINNTTYTVTVSNGGCTATASTTVAVNSDIVAAITGNTTICSGFTTLTATGGNVFSWSNGSNATAITITAPGTYTVTVSNDVGSCTATATATVQISTLSAAIGNIVNPICNTNGSMKVNISGGTSPYTRLWSNGATTATINNLSSGTYTVTVTDAAGCTKTASATLTDQAIGVPTNLTTTNITATTATFNWNAVAGAANYTILGRKVGAATWTTIGPVTGTSKTVTSSLVACKNYEWKVRANCASGLVSSAFSTIATFTTAGCPAKTDDISAINQTFSLQPNPANSLVTLNYASLNNSQLHIRVLDITGKEALSQNANTTEGDNQIDLPIGNLPQGYYVVEVNDGASKLHEKLIIAR